MESRIVTIKLPTFEPNDKELEMHTFDVADVLRIGLHTGNRGYWNFSFHEKYRYIVVIEFRTSNNWNIIAPYKSYKDAVKVYNAIHKIIYASTLETDKKEDPKTESSEK